MKDAREDRAQFIGSDLPMQLEKGAQELGQSGNPWTHLGDLLLRAASVLRDERMRVEELEATVATQREVIEWFDKDAVRRENASKEVSDERVVAEGHKRAGSTVPAGAGAVASGQHEQGEDAGDGARVHRQPRRSGPA